MCIRDRWHTSRRGNFACRGKFENRGNSVGRLGCTEFHASRIEGGPSALSPAPRIGEPTVEYVIHPQRAVGVTDERYPACAFWQPALDRPSADGGSVME